MDFSNSKTPNTLAYPVHINEASGLLRRCEPPLTPQTLKSRFLKGIPLVFPNGDTFSDDELKDRIMLAMNESETLIGRTITRESFKDKLPFDSSLYKSFIHLKTEHGPILSIERLAIVSANNANLFQLPAEWIETSNFSKNLINVIPLLAAYGINSVQGAVANAGIAFLATLDNLTNVPAYWEVTYTAGLSTKEGEIPVIVNQLIGCVAAIDLLSIIAPSNVYNSQALSQDGISQSSSGKGPDIYRTRIDELTLKREEIIKKLKAIFNSRVFVGNI